MILYGGIYDRMPLMFITSRKKLAISIQIFAVSDVPGGSYWNNNGNSGNVTDAAKLIFVL